jgi:tetratricopeptide (TPR) repeat protein
VSELPASTPRLPSPVRAVTARTIPGFASSPLFYLLAATLSLAGCGGGSADPNDAKKAGGSASAGPPDSAGVRFVEVTQEAGFRHQHHKPILDSQLSNIDTWVSSVGAAAAAGDYDRDGWIDLYVTNSRKGEPNYLYRNNGDGTFTDVAAQVGLAEVNDEGGASMDCVWADYDNDGWIDLYLVRWGTDRLFHNNGDGTFTETTETCFRRRDGSPGTDWANGNAAVFFDYDLDGRLDLYVGNYFTEVDLWHLTTTRILHEDFEKARNGGDNFLYHQEADGTFRETAEPLGLADPGWTLAVGSADVDNDGWPDLYCANDFGPDQLFHNNGDGSFRNVSATALGYDTKKGMNVDFGDFNNDGWLDIQVSNITTADYLQEGNMLWYNSGPDSDGVIRFLDIAAEAQAYDGGWGWGAKFLDSDDDGALDLLGVNGFITDGPGDYWYDLASWTVLGQDPADSRNWPAIGGRSFSGHEKTRYWYNDGSGLFTECASAVGLTSDGDGRGVVCFDYDNDGDLDVYLANQGQRPNFYRNDRSNSNHWLEVALVTEPATGVNRDGIGTRVTAVTAAGQQIRERDGGNSYCGQSDPRLHFGLGKEAEVQLLEVRWPDGGLQYLEKVRADQILEVKQDPSAYGAQVEVAVKLPEPRVGGATKPKVERPRVDPAQLEPLLSGLERKIREGSPSNAVTAAYRSRCAANDLHDRSIEFFRGLVEERPDDMRLRLELALAYVDKIPTCGGIAAVVSKGTLARKSLDQLDRVIAQTGGSWVAYYCRATNHLYWPRALRHSDDAVADFTRCLEIQKASGDPAGESYDLRTYVGLGDAYAKDKDYGKAREVWREGLKVFPGAPELNDRLQVEGDDGLLRYVEDQRSLERPIDTDLSFLDLVP